MANVFFFRCKIPTMSDGSVVTYSPGWCGTRPHCAKDEKGLLYNDKERWLLAQAEGDFIPPDVEVLTKEQVIELVKNEAETNGMIMNAFGVRDCYTLEKDQFSFDITPDGVVDIKYIGKEQPKTLNFGEQIYTGEKLAHRWDAKPELVDGLPPGFDAGFRDGTKSVDGPGAMVAQKMVKVKAMGFCGECMQMYDFKGSLPANLKVASITCLCPAGHKVKARVQIEQ